MDKERTEWQKVLKIGPEDGNIKDQSACRGRGYKGLILELGRGHCLGVIW